MADDAPPPEKAAPSVKGMILDALEGAGGVEYLTEQAKSNAPAFMQLVGKIMPLQVTGENGVPLQFHVVNYADADKKSGE